MEEGILNYPVEVELIGQTEQRQFGPYDVPKELEGMWEDGNAEDLIEWAGRLCYNAQCKTGLKPGWLQERIKEGHESLIEHASLTFWIKCSRVVTHELVRHRLGSYSQRSQRYVKESTPQYIEPPELTPEARVVFTNAMDDAWNAYSKLLKAGLKPEIARYVLPGACETQIVMTANFRELRHIIRLRASPKALPEMWVVAWKVRDICRDVAPEVFADV